MCCLSISFRFCSSSTSMVRFFVIKNALLWSPLTVLVICTYSLEMAVTTAVVCCVCCMSTSLRLSSARATYCVWYPSFVALLLMTPPFLFLCLLCCSPFFFVFAPSQLQAFPARPMLSACVVSSCLVMGCWCRQACCGSPDQVFCCWLLLLLP